LQSIEEATMTWWIWILVGLALLAVEVVIPGGIIMLFFGVSAMIVGVLVALGVGGPLWFQALLFSMLSVVSLLTLRGPILRRMNSTDGSADQVDSIAGKQAVVLDDIAPMAEGKVELRGTPWTAHNVGDSPLTAGQKCIVDRVDGLKLYVR
jgi:membrane protein implicated in regulation of membrane protease activity